MQGLRDIKGFVDIPDNSFYIFVTILVAVILIVGFLVMYLKKPKRRRKTRLTKEQLALKKLIEIDYRDTKDAVYTFCTNVQTLNRVDSTKKLRDELEEYKYKKEIKPLKDEHIKLMKKVIQEIKDAKN